MKLIKKFFLVLLLISSVYFISCGGGGESGSSSGGNIGFILEEGKDVKVVNVTAGSFTLNKNWDGWEPEVPGGTMITPGIAVDYVMAATEVTQELWEVVMGDSDNHPNPSYFTNNPDGSNDLLLPVETITWYDAIEFCNILSEKMGRVAVYTIEDINRAPKEETNIYGRPAGGSIKSAKVTADFTTNGYRLPTEMEWMWAAMGAGQCNPLTGYQKKYAGEGISPTKTILDYAWYKDNAGGYKPHQVGLKDANELGLRDMTGNVYEFCWDWITDFSEYSFDSEKSYSSNGLMRAIRGGSFTDTDATCIIAFRFAALPDFRENCIGFRFVRKAD